MSKKLRSNSARLRLECIQPHESSSVTVIFLFAESAAPATGRLQAAPTLRGVNASRTPWLSARQSRSSRGQTSRA
jgi:hypothetical protein